MACTLEKQGRDQAQVIPFCLRSQAPYKNQLEGLLLNNVMPCFDSPYGYLRAKACWVAGQYADIDFRDGQGCGPVFGSLFQKVVNAFQDPDLPVSIAQPVPPLPPLVIPPPRPLPGPLPFQLTILHTFQHYRHGIYAQLLQGICVFTYE